MNAITVAEFTAAEIALLQDGLSKLTADACASNEETAYARERWTALQALMVKLSHLA